MKTIYQKPTQKFVTVVVPVLNELKNVKILNKFLKIALRSRTHRFEIIYIDDFSTDGTYEYLTRVADQKEVFVYRKQGNKGKSFSLIEGFSHARGNILAMIDADLQYPVTALVEMIEQVKTGSDVVVANRKKIKTSFIRKVTSKGFRQVFGNMLFGLHTDVQSGLKVFKKRIYETVAFIPQTPWTFDLEFLYRVREAGYSIESFDISFGARQNGDSKVKFLRQTIEIGANALRVRAKKIHPVIIPPTESGSMIGAGVGHRGKQFITHTTLPHHKTAFRTFIKPQLLFLTFIVLSSAVGFFFNILLTAQIILTIVSVVYFIDVIFSFLVIWRSLNNSWELKVSPSQLASLRDRDLPVYSILCPLYKESKILPQFIEAMKNLDWPKEKLEVLLLLEEDDTESIKVIKKMRLPSYFRPVVVPYSEPKTKPKACNYGLNLAYGEYVVIFDAEDIPDPMQLKIAYYSFKHSDPKIICLQAKLNYYNPKQNLLTRFFTAEYSLWFDLTLPGFQSLQTSLPLGGTSNHFKTELLRKLHGWDTFNVTEDADLGIRLFKEGYKTSIIDSTTLEEANSNVHNWLRQRSRWIKGYLQSYLVHTRDIIQYTRDNRLHSLYMQLVIGTKLTFIFLNPLLWVTTVSYFVLYRYVGPTIEAAYLPLAFYLGVLSLIFGNFLFFYYYLIGNAKREQWDLLKTTIFIPLYWVLISIAGWIALYQLILKPHYWEKTIHGLHLADNKATDEDIDEVLEPVTSEPRRILPIPAFVYRVVNTLSLNKSTIATGSLLIVGTILAHGINLLFNVLIYRDNRIPLHTIGTISLLSSFFYLISIPMKALEATSVHKTALIDAKHGASLAYVFWKKLRKRIFYISMILALVWVALSPLMRHFFNVDSIWPFILFAPILVVAFEFSIDRGYMSGRFLFGRIGLLVVLEPFIKVAIAFTLISIGGNELVYSAIPYSFVLIYILGVVLLPKFSDPKSMAVKRDGLRFPLHFFFASIISGFSSIAFLSLDVLLANHFLSPIDAGKYAIVSLVGKMVYFLGGLSSQFVLPLASKYKDKKADSEKVLWLFVFSTLALTATGVVAFGIFGFISLPILLGVRALNILPFVFIFTLGTACFTVARVFSTHYLARNMYSFHVITTVLTVVQVVLVYLRHGSLFQFIQMMSIVGFLHLGVALILHLNSTRVLSFERSAIRFYKSLRNKNADRITSDRQPAILIFNWRDIKHEWAGGAEVYVHEIAKRWVKDGMKVTVFSGSDNKAPLDEVINGVKIIRRGGAYTVYAWAVLYYIFILRRKHDVIIDCENGIPFFTPLFSQKPVFLLIHHVHQDVFRQYLPYPMAKLAAFLESRLMPLLYKNKPVITVSESSRREIVKLGFSKPENIHIVYNGIDPVLFRPLKKTKNPSFTYLGRLKQHKNIDIAIKAFAKVLKYHPTAILNIVGSGEVEVVLKNLVKDLQLDKNVLFFGKVSEETKARILAESWVMIQPSGFEGWGITVIEANGSGTPVIASNVNGLKDSVLNKETGILVEPRNVKQLYYALDAIIADKVMLERYTKNALIWSRKFTWDKSADTLLGVIADSVKSSTYSKAHRGALLVNKGS